MTCYDSAATTSANCWIRPAFCSLKTRWEKSRCFWLMSMPFRRSDTAFFSSSIDEMPVLARRKSMFGLAFDSRKMAS